MKELMNKFTKLDRKWQIAVVFVAIVVVAELVKAIV